MKLAKTIQKCQFSNKKDLRLIISLGYLPPVNEFIKINSIKSQSVFFPTDLVYSSSSKLVQLSTIVNKSIVFPKSYPYTSSTTKILRENFSELSKECNKLINLNSTDLIVDIGSNDGNLLSNFKRIRRLGVTPENIGKLAIKKGIPTLLNYFDKKTANLIKKKYGQAKIITATNVFAHIDNIKELMGNVLKILKNDGVFITESHYLMDVLEGAQYDTIYHEHIRTYSLNSLVVLFEFYGMEVFAVERADRYGGNIRAYVARKGTRQHNGSVSDLLKLERSKGMDGRNIYTRFRENAYQTRDELMEFAYKAKRTGKRFVGNSCPGRCSTLLNFCGIGPELLPYLAEQPASLKLGMYLPGMHIPVVENSILIEEQPDYVLLLAWHYGKPIMEQLRARGLKSKFIAPLPKFSIIEGR